MAKKSKWKKRLKIGCLGFIGIIFILAIVASRIMSFSMSDEEVDEFYSETSIKPVSKLYEVDGYKMHYKVLEKSTGGTFVFIHGTPGSWDAFKGYFLDSALYNHATIASSDRPGFGKSSNGEAIASLEKQSELLKPILEKYPSPRILIGHSLGGPIVARMAMDYPELVEGIIMLAPALSPALEPEEDWFRVPMRWPILRSLVPKVMRVSNEEVIYLKEELELMLPLWKDIKASSVVIQGTSDNLVHPGNGPFADSMLVNAPKEIIMLDNQNHFLPWNETALIKKTMLDMLSGLKNKKVLER
jgi:pimeloyl-ACP methyl ester carboxylesterase